MGWYKVRPGQVLGISGKDVLSGEVIELSDALAHELKHKVDACTKEGKLLEAPAEFTNAQLESAREHERISILQGAVDQAKRNLEMAEAALAAEVARQKPAAPKGPDGGKK